MIAEHRICCAGVGLFLAGALMGCGSEGAKNVVVGFGEIELVSTVASTISRPTGEPVTQATASSVSASYYREAADLGCRATVIGPCTLHDCPPSAATAAVVPVSAGLITISGGKRLAELGPDAAGVYAPQISQTEGLFDGGEVLAINAAGGASIPAHAGAVLAPPPPSVSAPDLSQLIVAPRSQPLALNWAAADVNALVVSLAVPGPITQEGQGQLIARCEYDPSRNSDSVPAELLAALAPTGAGAQLPLSVETEKVDGVTTGGWEVTFWARSEQRGLITIQ